MNLKENIIISKDKNFNFSSISRSRKEEKMTLQLLDTVRTNYSKKLKRFEERNSNISHINYKVNHLLHDTYIFINAYAKISKNKATLRKDIFPKHDQQVIEFFGHAIKITEKFKKNSYIFKPTKNTLILKPGQTNKMRTIDPSVQEDRIVQEAIRSILECIYEPEFIDFENKTNFKVTNFGFRQKKSCFNAVQHFKNNSPSCNYIIEGDIVAKYNSINHHILLKILEKRIKDKKFLNVLQQLLKSGIMEKSHYIHPLAEFSQEASLSHLLFNIYMFEFDKFMYKIISKYNNEKKLKKNSEYECIKYKTHKLIKKNLLDTNQN
uniref:putative reverse transcriptase/maturase n=1 Tax=Dixoniella grisea TaxID=35153 RepID=UPI001FCCCBEA|nr:putative reverse transcriptase/maturase [Dixoniella grisea]UNJ17201.1 putative reverse transcriptase/maturase [Dixoniella grisea]